MNGNTATPLGLGGDATAGSPQATKEWNGDLNDLGMWNVTLSDAEVAALYNVPMYNGHTGALSQYGVGAMDQLFTLYDTKATAPAPVTADDGSTLTWQYVTSGLPGSAGSVGTTTGGGYYVQFDGSGGGVETVTVTPEPTTLALFAAGGLALLAYAWRKRS